MARPPAGPTELRRVAVELVGGDLEEHDQAGLSNLASTAIHETGA
jgi:hypothetical protein